MSEALVLSILQVISLDGVIPESMCQNRGLGPPKREGFLFDFLVNRSKAAFNIRKSLGEPM